MRERKGLGVPVPEAAEPIVRPSRTTAVGEAVPDQRAGALSVAIGTRSWPLVGTRLLVGREGGGAGAHVEIDDGSVSRRHAEFVASSGAWVLRDLGSTNGTWVGDKRLTPGEAVAVTTDVLVKFGNVVATVARS